MSRRSRLMPMIAAIIMSLSVESSGAGNPPPPPPSYHTSILPWTGVTAPTIDPSFVVGTTGITLGAIASGSGAGSYTLPSATATVKGGVTISTGLSITAGALSVSYGTTSGTAAQGNDNRITGAAQISNNLSDLPSAATARSNLGLGTMAIQNTNNVAITGGTISGVTLSNISGTWTAGTITSLSNDFTTTGGVLGLVTSSVPTGLQFYDGTSLNGLSLGSGLAVTSGVLSSTTTYTLPVAGSSLGGILGSTCNTGYTVIGVNTTTGALICSATPVGISGPDTSTSTNVAIWGNTTGTLLADGLPVGHTGNSTIVETTSGGTISPAIIPIGTSVVVGGVMPDNATLTNTNGHISVANFASEWCVAWADDQTVIAETWSHAFPFTSGHLTGLRAHTFGSSSPSFVTSVQTGASGSAADVAGCSNITVSSDTSTFSACGGAPGIAIGTLLWLKVTNPSGTPNGGQACVMFDRTPI